MSNGLQNHDWGYKVVREGGCLARSCKFYEGLYLEAGERFPRFDGMDFTTISTMEEVWLERIEEEVVIASKHVMVIRPQPRTG